METCELCTKKEECIKYYKKYGMLMCLEKEEYISRKNRSFSHRWVEPNIMEEILDQTDIFPNIIKGKSYRSWVFFLYIVDGMSLDDIVWYLPLEKEQVLKIVEKLESDIDEESNEGKRQILNCIVREGKSVSETQEIVGFSKPYIYRIINDFIK